MNLRTVKAYHIRLNLQTLWKLPTVELARDFLRRWCAWAKRIMRPKDPASAIAFSPLLRAVETVRTHADGILAYYRKRITTALMEGLNSLMQAARSRARGYRNPNTFKTMIYLIAARLDFGLPSLARTIARADG